MIIIINNLFYANIQKLNLIHIAFWLIKEQIDHYSRKNVNVRSVNALLTYKLCLVYHFVLNLVIHFLLLV